jgi:hypothetical protein
LLAASAAEPLRLRSSPFGPHQPSRPDRWPCKEHCCYARPDHGTNGLFRHCGIRGTRHGHRILGPPAVRRVSCPARRDRSAGCTPVHLTGSLVCGMPISLYGLEGGKLPAIKHFQVSNEETRHPPAGSRASSAADSDGTTAGSGPPQSLTAGRQCMLPTSSGAVLRRAAEPVS